MKKFCLCLCTCLLPFFSIGQTFEWMDTIDYPTPQVTIKALLKHSNGATAIGSFSKTVGSQYYGSQFIYDYNLQGTALVKDTLHRSGMYLMIDAEKDNYGNYYVVAEHFQDSGSTNFGTFTLNGKKNFFAILIKYNSNHQVIWAKRITTSRVFQIKYSQFDNTLYFSGTESAFSDTMFFDNFALDIGGFIAKYDLNGNCLWAKKVNEGSVTFIDVDQFNNIYAVTSNTGSSYYYLTKYDQQCNTQWNYYVGSSMKKIATDSSGNCYVTGSRYANSGIIQDNYFLEKISPNGVLEWSRKSTHGAFGLAIYVNEKGFAYTGGQYGNGNNQSEGMGIAKYDSNGNEIWHYQVAKLNPNMHNQPSEITEKDGAVYVGGQLRQQYPKGFVLKLHEPGVTTAIHEQNHLAGFSIYPNPGGSEFTLHYKNEKSKEPLFIYVRSITGQLVYTQTIPSVNGELREVINIGSQAKGNYFIEVRQGEAVEVRKLVVQ